MHAGPVPAGPTEEAGDQRVGIRHPLTGQTARELGARLGNDPIMLKALQTAHRIRERSEADIVDIYREMPPEDDGNMFRFKFLSFREVSRPFIEGSLNPLEIKMDLYTSMDQLDRGVRGADLYIANG